MTQRTHLTVRLNDETRQALERLLGEEPERGKLAVIVRDAIHRYAQQQGGVLWVGQGIWEGWVITRSHPDSSHGQPVLVDPEGAAYAPGDLLPGFGRVGRSRIEVGDVVEDRDEGKWGVVKEVVGDTCVAGHDGAKIF